MAAFRHFGIYLRSATPRNVEPWLFRMYASDRLSLLFTVTRSPLVFWVWRSECKEAIVQLKRVIFQAFSALEQSVQLARNLYYQALMLLSDHELQTAVDVPGSALPASDICSPWSFVSAVFGRDLIKHSSSSTKYYCRWAIYFLVLTYIMNMWANIT